MLFSWQKRWESKYPFEEKVIETKNKEGIKEIVDGLNDKNEKIASDCRKVLYEAGEPKPEIIEIKLMNSSCCSIRR
jgi:hypothetical protein